MSGKVLVHTRLNLRQALRIARRLGWAVESVRRTGQGRVTEASGKKHTFNARRESCPKRLQAAITAEERRQLAELTARVVS